MRLVTALAGAFAAALLILPTTVRADLTGEVQQGQQLANAVRSGQTHCSDLSTDDFELIGEYAMDRFLGNRAAHEAINEHMVRMMGEAGERRMHIALGYRFTGCPGAAPSSWLGPMAGMMGGYGGYRGAGPGMMGPRTGGPSGGGYSGSMMPGVGSDGSGDADLSGLAIAALAFGAAALGGLLVALAVHLARRRPGTAG